MSWSPLERIGALYFALWILCAVALVATAVGLDGGVKSANDIPQWYQVWLWTWFAAGGVPLVPLLFVIIGKLFQVAFTGEG